MEQTFPLYHGIIFPMEYVFVGNVYHHIPVLLCESSTATPKKMSHERHTLTQPYPIS